MKRSEKGMKSAKKKKKKSQRGKNSLHPRYKPVGMTAGRS
jgi:hypothetical protein